MKSPFICYFMAVCTTWIPALETESPQEQPMSLVMVHKENENPAKNPLPMTPLNLSRQPSSTIDQKLDELQRE